jgi:hypothetical protein
MPANGLDMACLGMADCDAAGNVGDLKQPVLYVTERCVFEPTQAAVMDPALFMAGPMGLPSRLLERQTSQGATTQSRLDGRG